MALTKVNRGGLNTGISDSSDATFLTVTSGEGATFAGTLAVTGVHTIGNNAIATSEGGAATVNVTQGLLKVWLYSAANGTAAYDSIGASSLGDTGTGHQTINFSNNFNNSSYVVTASQATGNNHTVKIHDRATSSQQIKIYDVSAGEFQDSTQFSQFSGDLA